MAMTMIKCNLTSPFTTELKITKYHHPLKGSDNISITLPFHRVIMLPWWTGGILVTAMHLQSGGHRLNSTSLS